MLLTLTTGTSFMSVSYLYFGPTTVRMYAVKSVILSGLLHRCLLRVSVMIYPADELSQYLRVTCSQCNTLSLLRVSVMKTNLQAVRHTGTDHSEPDESEHNIGITQNIHSSPKGKKSLSVRDLYKSSNMT